MPASRSTASSRSRPSCGRSAGATSSRSTSPSSSTRSCTCSARSRSSPAGCRSGGRSRRWWSGRRSPSRCLVVVAQAGRRLRPPGSGRDARDARLLGLADAQLALPRDRGDLLVRRAGARRGARAPGGGRGDVRPAPLRSCPVALCTRRHSTPCSRVLGFDVMRYVLRVVLPALTRVHGRARRALPRPPTTRASASAASFESPDQHLTWDGLRHVRDRDVRLLADARHEHRRLLPLHADAGATCGSGSGLPRRSPPR